MTISIRSNFFYTCTVPCELRHFDRAKPDGRRDKVLMLDARSVYRKVTRKTLRLLAGTTAYPDGNRVAVPGDKSNATGAGEVYLERVCAEGGVARRRPDAVEATLADLQQRCTQFAEDVAATPEADPHQDEGTGDGLTELQQTSALCEADAIRAVAGVTEFAKETARRLPETNEQQHGARRAFEPHAEALRGLVEAGRPGVQAGGPAR